MSKGPAKTSQSNRHPKSGSRRLMALFALGLLTTIAALTGGCGGGVSAALSRLQPLTDNCHGPVNGYAGIDFSATGRGNESLLEERLQAVHDLTDKVAACGGHMKVVAFSSSAAETFTLGEDDFPTTSGSTETARLIQADHVEGDLFDEVEGEVPTAEKSLQPNGSDVLAQLRLAAQYESQRGEGKLYVGLATDGIATTKPVAMNTPTFTREVARSTADELHLPAMPGAAVRIAGIGKTTGERQLHTTRIAAITAFYSIACRRTKAHCLVTTDYTAQGG